MKCRGFTLIEIIVAMSIFLLLSGAFTTFIVQSYRLQVYDVEQGEATRIARKAVEQMARELREARPGDNGFYPLEAGGSQAQSIIFYSDIDIDQTTERVRYFLEGSVLKKGVTEASGNPLGYDSQNEVVQVIAQYVVNSAAAVFQYYDGDSQVNPLSAPIDVTSVRSVGITVKVNITPERAPRDFTLSTFVALRNVLEER